MKNKIFALYEYRLSNVKNNREYSRYFIELYEVSCKIEISFDIFDEIIKRNNGELFETDDEKIIWEDGDVPFYINATKKILWMRQYAIIY
ncbi:MAG: hypothetical protein LBN95_09820 [Prevotellaceae bacterium]|jgi:hypothetical protein|nr:hypothetical protein [Prevotellaceae bacterium]